MSSDDPRELALVAQAVKGEVHALESLLLIHHERLKRSISRQLPVVMQHILSVDDVLQETYTRAFRHIESFRPQGPDAFYQWLSTIADNRLNDMIRRERARKRGGDRNRHDSIGVLLTHLSDHGRMPDSVAARKEAQSAMHVALAGLDKDYRRAIELRYIEGLDVKQTAARMNRSPRAVHMLCYRGLRKLAAAMGRASDFFSSVG